MSLVTACSESGQPVIPTVGVTAVHGLPAWQCWQRVLPPLVSGVPVGHEGWHWQRVLPPPLLPCRRGKPLKMASRQAGVGTALLAAL